MDHRGHNRITKLEYSQGIELTSHKEMESVFIQHFLNITEEPLMEGSRFINHFT